MSLISREAQATNLLSRVDALESKVRVLETEVNTRIFYTRSADQKSLLRVAYTEHDIYFYDNIIFVNGAFWQNNFQHWWNDNTDTTLSAVITYTDTHYITLQNNQSNGGIINYVNLTDGSFPYLLWSQDTTANRSKLEVSAGAQGARLLMGADMVLRVEGASGGTNEFGFGTISPSATVHVVGDCLIADTSAGPNLTVSSTTGFASIRVRGQTTGNGSIAYIDFVDSANTRSGFVGDGASGDSDIYVRGDTGNSVRIGGNGGTRMTVYNGVVVGSPTGGDLGAGTLNATGVYDDNTLLTDYVFEDDYELPSIGEMADFFKKHLHLPTIPGRDKWEKDGKFSLGELATHLWETVEVQARYIAELDERIQKLEKALAQ